MVTRFWPLTGDSFITSPFGMRGSSEFHTGVDFGFNGGSGGKPVFAVQDGTVQYAGAAAGYGGPDPAGWLVIDSDDSQGGGCIEYGHIIREVGVGARVKAGQRIARINPDSGTNGGVPPHLHVSYMPFGYDPATKTDIVPLLRLASYVDKVPATSPVSPKFTEIDLMGNSRSSRSGKPTYFLLHTEEGNSDAQSLARYCNVVQNGVSYHYTLRDSILVDVVDTDFASWSVLDANSRTINLCFAGSKASWDRAAWLKRSADIEIAAWIAVQDCVKYAIAPDPIGKDYVRLAKAGHGISDHRFVTEGLGIGTHTDVGDGFPWDVFAAHVARFTGKKTGFLMALTDAEQIEVRDNLRWLRAQADRGFPEWEAEATLGKNSKGERRTLREAVSVLIRKAGGA